MTYATEGDFMPNVRGGSTMFLVVPPNNGTIQHISDVFTSDSSASGSGVLATLQFKVIAQSPSTTITIGNIAPESYAPSTSSGSSPIPVTSTFATATVTFAQGGAPAANAGPNQVVTQGATVTLDGSASQSSGSNIAYSWSFMDGTQQTLTGKTATYTFSHPGIYPVTLTVTDSNGVGNSTVTIKVQSSTPPVAKIEIDGLNQDQTIVGGGSVILNATGSYEANNGTIVRYVWDMGDSSAPLSSNNATTTYSTMPTKIDQIFNITLTVIDQTGLNGTATSTLKVLAGKVGVTATPPPQTSTSPTSNGSDNPSVTPTSDTSQYTTSTPLPNSNTQQTGLPSSILALLIVITLLVLGGSTFWLRKKT